MDYPYTTPVILTDNLFTAYGGQVNQSTPAMRQAAYVIAERAICDDLDTYLTPTTIMGSYEFSYNLMLKNSYVSDVLLAQFRRFDGAIYYTISGSANSYLAIHDREYGLVDFSSYAGVCVAIGLPHSVDIVYRTGLSSGTSYSPNIVLAITTYATIVLNEMIGFGNETPGDWGVQGFSNQQYSEQRAKLFATTFGNSPKALFVHRLLDPFRKRRMVGRRGGYR